MVQKAIKNRPRGTRAALLAILVGSALLSATIEGAEAVLALSDWFPPQYVDVCLIAGVVVWALLAVWWGERMVAEKRYRGVITPVAVVVGGVAAFTIVHPDGALREYGLSPLHVIPLALGLTVWSGARLGAHYGVHGISRKIPHNKTALILAMFIGAFAYALAQNAIGGESWEHPAFWHLFAVCMVVLTVLSAALFGAKQSANEGPNQEKEGSGAATTLTEKRGCSVMDIIRQRWQAPVPESLWESRYWLFLFGSVPSIVLLYIVCFLPLCDGITLLHVAFGWSALVGVVGAKLGVRISSLEPRCGDRFWYGCVVLVFVFVLSAVHVLASQPLKAQCPDMDQSLMLAFVPSGMGALGALLGAHYSAYLKKQLGSG